MAREKISVETARVLYLTYGTDAVKMAELRCRELAQIGDTKGVESWREVLAEVEKLVAADARTTGSSH